MSEISTKPYLVRALYDWCIDQGYTPFISVVVDAHTQVPAEYVKNGEIVLNVGALATHRLQITNEMIEFQARFGGVARTIMVPIENVSSIYSRETGQGMAFEVIPLATQNVETSSEQEMPSENKQEAAPRSNKSPAKGGSRPALKRVK